MVVLKNINRTDADISADYYIEGRGPKGFMRLRLTDGKIVAHENAGYGSSHVRIEHDAAVAYGLDIICEE